MADVPLTLVDVGVRWGFPPRWLELAPPARLVGFDADPDECKVLAERHPGAEFVALALGEAPGRAELHVARETGSSSLFAPDETLHAVRPALAGTATVRTEPVELDTLAAWAARAGVERVDALKLDVQGAELAVLRGAGALLDGVRGLEVEVEFHPIYRGQPLFGDVDAFLRERGFVLWRLDDLHYHRPPGPATLVRERRRYDGLPEIRTTGGGGQLFWASASYVRAEVALGDSGTRADALVAHALGLDDLAAHLGLAAPRGRWRERLWRARHADVLGKARRLVAVRRAARGGATAEEISARTGLSVENVEQLLGRR